LFLTQTAAILEFIEEAQNDRPKILSLLPQGRDMDSAITRATIRRVVQIISCDIQPLQNSPIAHFARPDGPASWRRKVIEDGFRALEKVVAGGNTNGDPAIAGKHCVGDQVTLADVFLVPQVRNALGVGVEMLAFPTISRCWEAMLQLEEVVSVLEENGGVVQPMPDAKL
jgi:maleylacetoacetate isomerase